ncbi:hypothetical protein [Caballeronia mineralivorans]|uniref:hypothetical protein n=1 Tax=Caballeronia mineralivorans TaxID=2010198 RepID=UPI0023F410B1|nr:hypothetical protein [Caballeronia mineralivorans]
MTGHVGASAFCVCVDADLVSGASRQIEQLQRVGRADLSDDQTFEEWPVQVAALFALEAVAHDGFSKRRREIVRCVQNTKGIGRAREATGAEAGVARRRLMAFGKDPKPVPDIARDGASGDAGLVEPHA